VGILTDSLPFARAGVPALTIGRLTWRTLRTIHTPRDTATAFDDFIAAHANGSSLTADRLAAAEQAILDGIRRARSAIAEGAAISEKDREKASAGGDAP